MRPRILLYCLAALFAGVVLPAWKIYGEEISSRQEELDHRIILLYQIVDFMARRPHQMNVDAVFGLTMVEGHVKQTLDHENMQFFEPCLRATLTEVLDLCRDARLQTMAVVPTQTNESAILNQVLNNPEIWIRPIPWSFGLLGPRPPPRKDNTRENVRTYFYKGTPDETESDRCVAQLANDSGKRFCQVSDQCADMLLKNDEPRGYPLTHRLLYVQIAIALRCKERKNTPFKKLIPSYCTAILQDAVDMESADFPAISRDMVSEQVLLCGMEGYTEFANDHYARLIMSWANSAGCFSAYGFLEENERRRMKRENAKMDFGCDNHATALGAASLSLLIRHLVETLGWQSAGS